MTKLWKLVLYTWIIGTSKSYGYTIQVGYLLKLKLTTDEEFSNLHFGRVAKWDGITLNYL